MKGRGRFLARIFREYHRFSLLNKLLNEGNAFYFRVCAPFKGAYRCEDIADKRHRHPCRGGSRTPCSDLARANNPMRGLENSAFFPSHKRLKETGARLPKSLCAFQGRISVRRYRRQEAPTPMPWWLNSAKAIDSKSISPSGESRFKSWPRRH